MRSLLSMTTVLFASSLALAQARDPSVPRQPAVQVQTQTQVQTPAGTAVQGKIVSIGDNQVMVRTNDNKDVTLYMTPQTRYTINNKAARFSDLRVGSVINTTYTPQGTRYMVNSLAVGPPAPAAVPAPATQPTIVEGTVVKVVGNNQVIVKTPDNKEVVIYVNPQTQYLVKEQPVQFSTFTPGYPVRVEYDTVGNRFFGRRIFGRR